MQHLSLASPAGVFLSLGAVLILLTAFACLGSKLFDRYLTYYGLQSVLLAAAAATAAVVTGDDALWVLAGLTLCLEGIAIPLAARRLLAKRLQPIQSGDVNLYLLYVYVIFVTVLIVYAVAVR